MRHSLLLLALILVACGPDSGRFRLEGRFKNLNQGEFFIYNIDLGRKDTIGVRDGRFVYDVALADTAVLTLLFPNYSELPVFARPGTVVTMKGDVSHLREVEVSGTSENELMTAFRLRTNDMMPPQVLEEAKKFIANNPESPVSHYLLRRYVLLSSQEPDYPEAHRLCQLMLEHQAANVQLVHLEQQLRKLLSLRTTGQLPHFEAIDEEGHPVTIQQLTSQANIIYVWGMWDYTSQSTMRQLNALKKEHGSKLSIVTISLDASPADHASLLKSDSICWPNICDSLLWKSPLLEKLGIATMPASIVIDQDGYIVARNLDYNGMKEKVEELLK